jgi:hypothetical protein
MTIVLEPTRDELITAWHRRNPDLTAEEAAMWFDEWWECGALDPQWDEKTQQWKLLLLQGCDSAH